MGKENHPRPSTPHALIFGALAISAGLLAGCANQSASGSVYKYNQAQRENVVRLGTVVSITPVTIQSDRTSGAGLAAGAAVGGIAGNAIGKGNGRRAATVGAGLLGSLLGNTVENKVNTSSGYAITVEFDRTGDVRSITQEDDIDIRVGQRVQIVGSGASVRVLPL